MRRIMFKFGDLIKMLYFIVFGCYNHAFNFFFCGREERRGTNQALSERSIGQTIFVSKDRYKPRTTIPHLRRGMLIEKGNHKMEDKKKNFLKHCTDKIYGGLKMSWLFVIIFAVAAAVLTAAILIIPAFKDTSFAEIGVTLEAWIFFAVIIMSNCKKPLESALKTFVFFLVSQPLIYLLQVPFSSMGWGLFNYYPYWFCWTLATFPMAFVGWFIQKKNWLSVLIFSPVFLYLGNTIFLDGKEAVKHFPHMLVATLFCIFQIVLYVCVFFPKIAQKAVGIALPSIMIIVMLIVSPQVAFEAHDSLPDEPSFSAAATLLVEDDSIAEVEFEQPEDGRICITAHKYGETLITISDNGKEYKYLITVYDDNGVDRERIEPVD